MKTDKWLYFRSVAAVASDDGESFSENEPTSICIPASSVVNMYPTNDTTLRIGVTAVKHQGGDTQYTTSGYNSTEFVDLAIGTNKHKEVMAAINSAATNARTPFIVIADDVAGKYIHSSISDCTRIHAPRFPPGVGVHEYFEVLTTSVAANADGKVCAELDMKIPAQAILLEAAITARVLGSHANGAVRLDFHSATTANGASAAGTEWIGAGSSGATSIPNADLDAGSGAVLNATVHSGTAAPISRGTAETFLQVVACEDLSGGAPIIGVYVKWFGSGGRLA
jgi:hypothetical protein